MRQNVNNAYLLQGSGEEQERVELGLRSNNLFLITERDLKLNDGSTSDCYITF